MNEWMERKKPELEWLLVLEPTNEKNIERERAFSLLCEHQTNQGAAQINWAVDSQSRGIDEKYLLVMMPIESNRDCS